VLVFLYCYQQNRFFIKKEYTQAGKSNRVDFILIYTIVSWTQAEV